MRSDDPLDARSVTSPAELRDRNDALLELRAAGASTWTIARELGISQTRVRELLGRFGDPLRADDGERSEASLEAELAELRQHHRRDGIRIRELKAELEVRATDRVLGLR